MPTVLLIPGSFCPIQLYDVFIASLKARGITSVVVDTPSIGRRPTGPHNMTDDVNAIEKAALELLDAGEDVVLMPHSYGGIPTTQSLERLSTKARSQQGKKGIDSVIYMTSVILQPGQCNFDLFGADLRPDYLTVTDDYMTLAPEGTARDTFSDIPPEDGLRYAKMFPDHATPAFQEKLTYPGYNDVDVSFIVCTEDKVIPVEAQRAFIEWIKMSSGKDVKVRELKAGHAPTIGHTDAVADIVKDLIG